MDSYERINSDLALRVDNLSTHIQDLQTQLAKAIELRDSYLTKFQYNTTLIIRFVAIYWGYISYVVCLWKNLHHLQVRCVVIISPGGLFSPCEVIVSISI